MVLSHTRRLLVVNLALNACPLCDAFQPWLAQSAQRHPDVLFGRLALDAVADEGAQRLLSALSVGALPVTLLLWGRQLMAQLEAAGAEQRPPTCRCPPEAAARKAALELHSAIMQAKLQARLQHADCAAEPAAAALAPRLAFA